MRDLHCVVRVIPIPIKLHLSYIPGMQEIIFIDEGSLPTPEGITREWVKAAAENRNEDEKLFSMIREAFRRKIDVGVHVPTYPQFRDKIGQFLDIIKE